MNVRTPLIANAVFSVATGLALTLAPATIAGLLGVADADVVLRVFGVVLLGHALILGWVVRQPAPMRWAKLNFLAIAPYPLMLMALLVGGVVSTTAGRVLLVGDGLVIGTVAVLLYRTIWGATPAPNR